VHVCSLPALHCVAPAAHWPAGHPHCPALPAALHTSDWPAHEAHGLPPLPHAFVAVPATQVTAFEQQPRQLLGPHASVQVIPSPV